MPAFPESREIYRELFPPSPKIFKFSPETANSFSKQGINREFWKRFLNQQQLWT
jgi:hypothetical protein